MIIILLCVIVIGGIIFITSGAKEYNMSYEDKIWLTYAVNGSISFNDIPQGNQTAIINVLQKKDDVNKNLITFFIIMMAVTIFFFMMKSQDKPKYISLEECETIVINDLERLKSTLYQTDPTFDYGWIGNLPTADTRWWSSINVEPQPFLMLFGVNIMVHGVWKNLVYCLDVRFEPLIAGHITARKDLPFGFKGTETTTLIDYVPIEEGSRYERY